MAGQPAALLLRCLLVSARVGTRASAGLYQWLFGARHCLLPL
jgi:hypothetical protein